MSDLRIKVKYYDIEVEVSLPCIEASGEWGKKYTSEMVESIVYKSQRTIEQLIEAGRRTLPTT